MNPSATDAQIEAVRTELEDNPQVREAGFCDQSHMSRVFRRVLGRSPSAVRDDRREFRKIAVAAPVA